MKKIAGNKNAVIVYKEIGETPLEALERFRATRPELAGVPMTYAGRLDPMAEGELLILIGEECKNKERWLGLDKEYEVEIVFGIETDTYDALGLARRWPGISDNLSKVSTGVSNVSTPYRKSFDSYIGRFTQEYPPYSSRAVNGKQLHELARACELPKEMPTKDVEIYSIDLLEQGRVSGVDLKAHIFGMIDKVKGDFRQEAIKKRWAEILKGSDSFEAMKLRVKCSSGTYMRSLANRMEGFALHIRRTCMSIDNSKKI